MPITAKLSRAFYERFGDEITDELVNWFNAVDETYRTDLRELNELNFARFDAKLGERLAELNAKWSGRWNALDAKLEQRIVEVRADLKSGLLELGAALRTEMAQGAASLKSDLLKWMFGFWATTVLAIAALYIRG